MLTAFPDSAGIEELRAFIHDAENPADRAAGTATVGYVPAAPYVRPALVLDGSTQFVAFYDAEKWLTVAHRSDWGLPWQHQRLDSRLAWDSHNYPSIAVDRGGFLHVATNMHAAPMTYFRSERPHDPSSLVAVPNMVSAEMEGSVTYPEFVVGPDGSLSFWFRDGSSGDGVQRVYLYDDKTRSWSTLHKEPLIDGLGRSSAYLEENRAGVDASGYWLTWVWRNSPDAASTHSICYARSDDLHSWSTADGRSLTLPITPDSPVLVGEPEPGRGLINNNVRSVRSATGAVSVVYHSRDEAGSMQIRKISQTTTGWVRSALTDWNIRWDFGGEGTLAFEIEVGQPRNERSTLVVPIRYRDRVAELRGDGKGVTAGPAHPPWPGIDGLLLDGTMAGITQPRVGAESAFLWWESHAPSRDLAPSEQIDDSRSLRVGTVPVLPS